MKEEKKYVSVVDEKEESDLKNATDKQTAKKKSLIYFFVALLILLLFAAVVWLFWKKMTCTNWYQAFYPKNAKLPFGIVQTYFFKWFFKMVFLD